MEWYAEDNNLGHFAKVLDNFSVALYDFALYVKP